MYWARDLFFIFVDGGSLAMDAWLSAYHLTQQPALRVQQLDALGGYVVAGVVFKVSLRKAPIDTKLFCASWWKTNTDICHINQAEY